MRTIAALLLGLGLASSAHAATGRTTDRLYPTMKAAAAATAAYVANRNPQIRMSFSKPLHASDMAVRTTGISRQGQVRIVNVATPRARLGYPVARIEVKVKKLTSGWKGYTDGAPHISLLR